MTDAINTSKRPPGSGISTTARTDADITDKTAKQQGKSGSSSTVELSNPNVLKDIGAQIRNIPDVNNAKVEAIKRGLTNGEYQPNPEVIAKKFTEIENLLP